MSHCCGYPCGLLVVHAVARFASIQEGMLLLGFSGGSTGGGGQGGSPPPLMGQHPISTDPTSPDLVHHKCKISYLCGIYYHFHTLIRLILWNILYCMCSLHWLSHECLRIHVSLANQINLVPASQYKQNVLWRNYVTTRDGVNLTLICIIIRGGVLCGSIDGYVFTT